MKWRFVLCVILCMVPMLLIGYIGPSISPSIAPLSPTPKEIVISYSPTTMDQVGKRATAGPGYTYLVVSLDIEDNGYSSFSTNPFYFLVTANKVEYAPVGVGLEDELRYIELLDGGKICGKLVFRLPKEVTNTGYQLKYKYQDWGIINVEWIKQQQC